MASNKLGRLLSRELGSRCRNSGDLLPCVKEDFQAEVQRKLLCGLKMSVLRGLYLEQADQRLTWHIFVTLPGDDYGWSGDDKEWYD
jgi:hypothetical protein